MLNKWLEWICGLMGAVADAALELADHAVIRGVPRLLEDLGPRRAVLRVEGRRQRIARLRPRGHGQHHVG